jgi:hypothetical protein
MKSYTPMKNVIKVVYSRFGYKYAHIPKRHHWIQAQDRATLKKTVNNKGALTAVKYIT